MNKPVRKTDLFVRLFFIMIVSAAVTAQTAGPTPLVAEKTGVQSLNPRGTDPNPEDATRAILTAFNKYEVIGMTAAHDNKDVDDFILHLIRESGFPGKVQDIVVECGNSLYQPMLDRYIAGAEVSQNEIRQVWRNTTQSMCGTSAFYEELFPLIRRINQRLRPEMKLRVLAADPPMDWSKVKEPRDMATIDRELSIASVMKKEVFSKHRKALMLFGIAHLYHKGGLAVEIYEKDYPSLTMIIADHEGFFNWRPESKYNDDLERRMSSWPVPSLIQNIQGTWLANLSQTFFPQMADAYLYLGPRDLLLKEPKPASILLDKDYMIELKRRAALWGDPAHPENLLKDDLSPFFYDPDLLRKIIGTDRWQPGKPPNGAQSN
jgi:hypothetical protein